ncbi:unnamed protein product [Orchesella dallaii]|uniref:Disintegrin domain-containing protein n=1 Tax=Orchesella dallaii TaxID=48710 RepID=A0ABP1RAL8_9HEXA
MVLVKKHLISFSLLAVLVAILVATCNGNEGNDDVDHQKIDKWVANVHAPRRFRRQVAVQEQRLIIAPNEIPDEFPVDDSENGRINIHRRADLDPTSRLLQDPHLLQAPAAEAEIDSDKIFVNDDSYHLESESANNNPEHYKRENDDGWGQLKSAPSSDRLHRSSNDFHQLDDDPKTKDQQRREGNLEDLIQPNPEEKINEVISEHEVPGSSSDEKLQTIPNPQKQKEESQKSQSSQAEVISKLSPQASNDDSFTLFTIANTDIGRDYNKIPYREHYRWDDTLSNCASFNLKIPDEMAEKSMIKLCIFRPFLEFPDETESFILNPQNGSENATEKKVYGYVVNHPGSTVNGTIHQNRFFFGEVSIPDEAFTHVVVYYVEDIHLVFKRMNINDRSLKRMLMVMNAKNNKTATPVVTNKNDTLKHSVYNAAVTKGFSLNALLDKQPDQSTTTFLMLTTKHNSYICLKEPQMWAEDGKLGKIKWGLDLETTLIEIDNDEAVYMKTPAQDYTFRPNGRTIVMEGTSSVQTLQEHEGAVAITAYTKQSKYDCVLPTPTVDPQRKGGYLCKVCIAADKEFIEAYDKEKENATSLTQNYLGRIIDHVSWIFRSTDYNNDKKSENVGLSFESQAIDWKYPSEVKDETVNEQLLILNLQEIKFPTDCCLGIGYTMKVLPDYADGKRPSDKSKNDLGRVCNRQEGKPPNNLIVVSANGKVVSPNLTSTPITEKQLIYLTAHKVAAAFGAKTDGSGQDTCDQFFDEKKKTRHYLMWPATLRNTTLREQTLSPCSKTQILQTLTTCHSSCFDIDEHPFCGNGRVEAGEECDCGSEYQCSKQTCCFSRNGERPCQKTGIGCKAGASTLITSGMSSLTLLTLALTYFHISW